MLKGNICNLHKYMSKNSTAAANNHIHFGLLHPDWDANEYELIDSGNGEKLEKFGEYVCARPEPQALWDKKLSDAQWEDKAQAYFKKEANNPDKGQWLVKPEMPDNWWINYRNKGLHIKLKCSLSSFKHVGIFPEQAANWDFIYKNCLAMAGEEPVKVLNLFAYTGGASIAAKAANADVTHVDAIKQVISWARENMEGNAQKDIRWMVEDAMKFVQREERRGNTYEGIILDPPAYGRGPNGEKWELEDHLLPMLKICAKLLNPNRHFVVINLYSLGMSALIVQNLAQQVFNTIQNPEAGELFIPESEGRRLPLGTYYRFCSLK